MHGIFFREKIDYLTTERSEVVPFFRAVRLRERGCGATPMGGEAPQTRSRSDPYFGVGYPSVRQFVIEKLSQTLTDFDETWQE